MKWVLVYIVLSNGEITATNHGMHDSMNDCFMARDELKLEISYTQYFPLNSQAVCINTKEIKK